MNSKLLIVAWQEVEYHLRQWTFYLTIIMMPLVFAAVGALPRLQNFTAQTPFPQVETILNASPSPAEIDVIVGYVDRSGIITSQTGSNFRSFSNQAAATSALDQGEIESFYVMKSWKSPSGSTLTD